MKSNQEIILEGKCPECGNAAEKATLSNILMPNVPKETALWCKRCSLIVPPDNTAFMTFAGPQHTEDHFMCPGCERETSDDPEPVIDEADFRDE